MHSYTYIIKTTKDGKAFKIGADGDRYATVEAAQTAIRAHCDRDGQGTPKIIVAGEDWDLTRSDELCRMAMALRPDLEQMSLDEFILEHHDKLTHAERQVMDAVLAFHPDYRTAESFAPTAIQGEAA